MSTDRHLVLQELILRPSGEWAPCGQGWTIARVAEGSGYWMQGGNARELNVGDGLILASKSNGRLRASQLGTLKVEWFTVQPQFLNGLLTVTEWHQIETGPGHSAPCVLHFTAHEPTGQKFGHIANQTRSDGLTMRCALLQLWASAMGGLLAAPAADATHANKLRERFRQVIGQMPEAELPGSSLGKLAEKLHCSERHFSRLFREEFGVPLRARQIELRLQRAQQLLMDSDAKIINVAFDSGFRHLGLFNAMFKKRFGMTPSEWRQQNARKNPPATPPAQRSLSRLRGGIGVLIAALVFWGGLTVFGQTGSTTNNMGATLRAALMQKMAELDAQEQLARRMARIHVVPVSTNAGPRFRVDRYAISGNTQLPPGEIGGIFTNVPAAFGTNVTLDAILAAAGDLQTAYRERGFMTVKVWLPPQKLTNDVVKVNVTEARLAAINVNFEGGRYFSSNNVMRALPDLRTNILLNAKVFQRELDAANLNSDRQIYPVIGPGPEPGTSELTLTAKERLPLHLRLEVNNDATPGTPDLRANFSAQYNNLWDLEHQIGLQYSFSFNAFKNGSTYDSLPFDAPQVANYSGYYRLPLGGYPSVQAQVDAHPGSFGFNEATHQFNLPPATGRSELTLYGSRSTSDTGVQFGPSSVIVATNNFSLNSQDSGESFILNENLGGRFSVPLPPVAKVNSTLSFGMDFKRFRLVSFNTNNFPFSYTYTNSTGPATLSTNSASPQPVRYATLDYLPFNVGLNGSVPDKWGATFFNGNANFNPLAVFSKSADFSKTAYSTKAQADYVTIQAGADRQQALYKDWSVRLHADGQWAGCPLIGNEQYVMGGTAGVRGYPDGEAYGDEGWRVTIEPQTPPLNIGMIGNEGDEGPCWLHGSAFMDYGEVHLLDASPGTSGSEKFWGVGWSVTANLGSHLDGRVTMAWPLTSTAQTRAGDAYIYFGVGGQF